MTVLITGGAGFIGSNLAERLVQRGHEVRVLDDLSTGRQENLEGLDLDFRKGTLLDEAEVDAAVRGVDAIVHLAAIGSVPRSVAFPRASHDANATGTLNVLEAARAHGGPQVVVASSSSVYGSNPALPKSEQQWTRPMSPYAVSKLTTEAYTIAYQASYGLPTLAARFFNVYGPRQDADHPYAAVIPRFISAALAGRAIEVHGDGEQTRDFTFVGTVCDALIRSVEDRMTSPSPINFALGTNTSLMSLIEVLEAVTGRAIRVEHVEPRVGDVRDSQADGILFRETFPGIDETPLEEGLRRTVAWFEEKSA